MNPGRIIEKYRIEKGLSKQDLGNKIGVSRGQIARMENGSRTISVENFMKLAAALEIPPEMFLPEDAIRRFKEGDKEALALSLEPDILEKYSDEDLINFIRLGRTLTKNDE